MKMGMRLAGLTWCTLAALAVPALAHAQSDAPVTRGAETDGERAAPYFQEGLRAGDQKQWPEAEAAYLKAWAIAKAFDIAANLGIVELKLGKPRLAAMYLAFSLRTAPPSTKAPNLERTRQLLEQAKKPIGVVRVRGNVAEATVMIDGKPLSAEETADEIFVEPGRHRVTARREGYRESEETVTVQAGAAQEVALALVALPAGTQMARMTPARHLPAAPVEAAAKRSWVPVIALGAASVVGLGVGIGMTVASNNASSDADTLEAAILRAGPGCRNAPSAFTERCAELNRTGNRAGTFGDIALGSYVLTGVFVLSGITYALWPRATGAQARTTLLVPHVDMHGAGMMMAGAW